MITPSATPEELGTQKNGGGNKILQSICLPALGIVKDFEDYGYFYLWNLKDIDSNLYM